MTILAVGDSFMCHRDDVIPQCEIIAKNLNKDIDNLSIPGNGNTHIMYHTMEAILNNPNKYSLVLIGWSNAARWDFVTTGNKWFAIKSITEHTEKKIDIDKTLFIHWASDVLTLSDWLRSKNIKFLMWNSLSNWQDGETVIHKELTSIKEFYKVSYSHLEEVRKTKQWYSNNDHHPNQESHILWANALYELIEQNDA